MSVESLRVELRNYYCDNTYKKLGGPSYRHPLTILMDEYAAAHPGLSPVMLKAAQYEIIADNFTPVIFKNTPFYSEMGVKAAEYDGVPSMGGAGGWLFRRNSALFRDANPAEHDQFMAAGRLGVHLAYSPYADYDHHCFPYTNVLKKGLSGIYAEAEAELRNCETREETEFIECAMRGLLAVKKIAEKFSAAAESALKDTDDETQRRFLGMISKTAREIPWRRPETFYGGLCAVWFLHEVCASVEGIGMSVIGHIDRMLGTLYQDDLESGRLTKEEAYDLISRFLLATDAKLDLRAPIAESFNRQEQGDTLILGGRGGSGAELCNDITLMTLKAHGELNLIYPKIHCRISSKSKRELFDAANSGFLKGRNVISFLSDEALIPAQIRAGKRPEDAESYVAGGCWEIILEGAEHSAGANCYFNLAKIIDMSIHDSAETEAATGYVCDKIAGSQSFEELYRTVMDNVIRTIRRMCSIIGKNGAVWPLVNPAPFFSACLSGCLKNRRDYSAGGGRYNPHGLPLTNFAVFIDSLHVVRKLCFEDKKCSLDGLLDAVRADWRGYETLRAKALAVPRFGCDTEDTNTLARRVLDEIYERTSDLKNERGGPFQIGLYSYRDIIDWAGKTRATPDGRKTGDFLSQGLTPSRLNNPGAVTSVINSGAALDLGKCPANSVITVTLPLRGANLRVLEQLERAFAKSGIGLLQLNCVDKEELLDARKHPERHQDLIVRLYGYSARFVCLTPEMQDEFISRNVHSAQSC